MNTHVILAGADEPEGEGHWPWHLFSPWHAEVLFPVPPSSDTPVRPAHRPAPTRPPGLRPGAGRPPGRR
ncbi:hypothetical protein Afil01_52580 [Actinorhabdospora filicis]|uniref:Uncharacterized protein n=1 Tax=Actinorhabdospora filicis TaxID=1785913 RepID=A0A9W6WCC4_9ACTN|nr:hypothetical protein [Actinorhabdospora filicis]GLZ80451.1 hypothetical protein Afil01_52580 [Actinorhabdospora filicis]